MSSPNDTTSVDIKFLNRAKDNLLLAQELIAEADKLKKSKELSARLSAFSIYTQWIETSLTTWVFFIKSATSEGVLFGWKVKNKRWNLSSKKERNLRQKAEFISSFHMSKDLNPHINEFEKIQKLLDKFIPLRNKLTHEIFQIDFIYTKPHKDLLNRKLDEAIKLAEAISDELTRLATEVYPGPPRLRIPKNRVK